MKKFIKLNVLLFIFGIAIMSGCGNSDKSDNEYIKSAQNIIGLFNNEKSEDILNLLDDNMKSVIDEQKLKEIFAVIKENGNFQKFEDAKYEAKEIEGKKLHIIVQKVKYAKKDLIYTISFDEVKKLAGIYFK